MAGDDLQIQARLRGGASDLYLENAAAGYELEKTTREERAVTFRRQEVTNPWVGGTYVVTAVPENVVEKLAVWVTGATHKQLEQRIYELTRRISASQFYVDWTLGNQTERWFCMTSDYTIRTQQEYMFATTALVSANVSRLPRTVIL